MNFKSLATTLMSGILLATVAGCASSTPMKTQDSVVGVTLTQNNYKVVRTSAMGVSRGFRLLGIIPFGSPSYATAKQRLYESVGEPLTGRSIALANQAEDRSTLYLILFSIPKLTLTADVIEFTDKPTGQ